MVCWRDRGPRGIRSLELLFDWLILLRHDAETFSLDSSRWMVILGQFSVGLFDFVETTSRVRPPVKQWIMSRVIQSSLAILTEKVNASLSGWLKTTARAQFSSAAVDRRVKAAIVLRTMVEVAGTITQADDHSGDQPCQGNAKQDRD